ncbi:site-2 protease family protein [Infirmifilum lucidum]|uniref:Site-2 protease family protein n=1 Tax=Infirmifilum lucidum TaxID=2776706 RepID=A0A7L9FIK1_9CREN|nr:site-2 protease family protein [Infirmifilum lucidum]QOJ79461.1 site-2 protease family protein [Infirmifilum lucidum]
MAREAFYPREVQELTLATLAVFAVLAGQCFYALNTLNILRLLTLAFLIYVPHELAHKFVAQYYGYPARYSILWEFFLITLLSAIPLIPIKFIAPGTVYIYTGTGITRRENGIISAAGPATNILLGTVGLFAGGSFARIVVNYSGWIAFFNLLPIGPLDGKKVLDWNAVIWGAMIVMALFMVFY